MASEQKRQRAGDAQRPVVPTRNVAGPRVLVIEQVALIAMDIEDGLRASGFEVVGPFGSLAQALQAIRDDPPEAAIMEVVVNDESCLPVARALRRREVPFVIYSGRQSGYDDAPEFAGVPWIAKPAPNQVIVSAIKGLLTSK